MFLLYFSLFGEKIPGRVGVIVVGVTVRLEHGGGVDISVKINCENVREAFAEMYFIHIYIYRHIKCTHMYNYFLACPRYRNNRQRR